MYLRKHKLYSCNVWFVTHIKVIIYIKSEIGLLSSNKHTCNLMVFLDQVLLKSSNPKSSSPLQNVAMYNYCQKYGKPFRARFVSINKKSLGLCFFTIRHPECPNKIRAVGKNIRYSGLVGKETENFRKKIKIIKMGQGGSEYQVAGNFIRPCLSYLLK